MDELQTIREALEYANSFGEEQTDIYSKALAALSRLEARAAEMPDTSKIVWEIDRICNDPEHKAPNDSRVDEASALIGQYAYRYSEDIRKDRDEWRAFAVRLAGELNDKIAKI